MFFKNSKKENKRVSPRINIINDAYCMIDGSEEKDTIKCWCRNLSEGGMAINTEVKIPENANSLKILYRINSKYRNDKVIIKSQGKDQNYNRYGCQFADNDKERDVLISDFIQQQA